MKAPTSLLLRAVISGLGLASLVAIAGGGVAHVTMAAATGAAGVLLLRRRFAATRRRRHDQALAAGLPDVIDLLAATVDGGVATDVALGRVARFVDEPLRSLLVDAVGHGGEVGIGARLCALDPLLRPLGALLRQSEELGVPIAGALRLLAADARDRARSSARERAAAAAPKMLLVVGALLAPASLLIVIGGQLLVLRDIAGGMLV
jgi:tight adherence protein C